MTDPSAARDRAIDPTSPASLAWAIEQVVEEHRRGEEFDESWLFDIAERLRALAGAPAPVATMDDLSIIGNYLCARVDTCTCASFEGQHEPHCGWEPIADATLLSGVPAPAPAPDVARLLAECDRVEQHIRDNVPHLPPDGGSLGVRAIRKMLGVDTRPETAEETTDASD